MGGRFLGLHAALFNGMAAIHPVGRMERGAGAEAGPVYEYIGRQLRFTGRDEWNEHEYLSDR